MTLYGPDGRPIRGEVHAPAQRREVRSLWMQGGAPMPERLALRVVRPRVRKRASKLSRSEGRGA